MGSILVELPNILKVVITPFSPLTSINKSWFQESKPVFSTKQKLNADSGKVLFPVTEIFFFRRKNIFVVKKFAIKNAEKKLR